jgi:hypothetical protein
MSVQLVPSVTAEVVLDSYIESRPRLRLESSCVAIAPYDTMEQYEKHLSETRGSSRDWFDESDEFRFSRRNHLLQSLWVGVRDRGLPITDAAIVDSLVSVTPKVGNLQFLPEQRDLFSVKPSEHRWIDPEGQILVGFYRLIQDCSEIQLRLRVAQDFDLLFSQKGLCAWMLKNPAQYLATEDTPLEAPQEISKLLADYFTFIDRPNIYLMEDADPTVFQKAMELETKLKEKSTDAPYRELIIAGLRNILDNFYDI